MANVWYYHGTWTSSGPSYDLFPGQSHSRVTYSHFGYGDALTITPFPVRGPWQYALVVENVRFRSGPGGPDGSRVWIEYEIRNDGSDAIPGYIVAVGVIAP
jgi:hypothetical protein